MQNLKKQTIVKDDLIALIKKERFTYTLLAREMGITRQSLCYKLDDPMTRLSLADINRLVEVLETNKFLILE